MSWQASEKTDDDLIAARDFIAADNERAALDFLDAAFETFEQLSKFPEMLDWLRLCVASVRVQMGGKAETGDRLLQHDPEDCPKGDMSGRSGIQL